MLKVFGVLKNMYKFKARSTRECFKSHSIERFPLLVSAIYGVRREKISKLKHFFCQFSTLHVGSYFIIFWRVSRRQMDWRKLSTLLVLVTTSNMGSIATDSQKVCFYKKPLFTFTFVSCGFFNCIY